VLRAAGELVEPTPHGGEVFRVGREHGFHPRQILDFSSSINPLGPPPSAIHELKESLWKIPIYPDNNYHDFRSAVTEYLGLSSTENVVEGNGSTELIYLFASLFAGKERAIIPLPTFEEYERAILINGGIPVHISYEENFGIAIDRILNAIDNNSGVLFLCNPNNPTSLTIPKRKLLRLIERASEKDVKVLLDETFVEFVEEGEVSLSSRVEEFPNLFIIRSLTKFFALPGLRIGYGLASRKTAERFRSAKMPWSVNALAQDAAIAALHDLPYIQKSRKVVTRERDYLYSKLKQVKSLAPFKPEANFILSRILGGMDASELQRELLGKRVLIRDCSSFKGLGKEYFRVSVKLTKQNAFLISALKEALG
jgi:threonine-phosphate decarboxylase